MFILDCFYNEKRGILKTFSDVDNEKFSSLFGNMSESEKKTLDTLIKSKIGILTISPYLKEVFASDLSITEKQDESIKGFLFLYYDNLTKLKNKLSENIKMKKGTTKTTTTESNFDRLEKVNAFNDDEMSDDERRIETIGKNEIVGEDENNAKIEISNIYNYSNFLKVTMLDYFVDFIKKMWTLQIVD